MKKQKLHVADLFCGAGGTSTGLIRACEKLGYEVDLLAVNHWDVAVATHQKNHPNARHMCATLDTINPELAFPGGRLDLLVASPECTHFSNARGGKPMNDQKRSTPWDILPWIQKLYVENVLIENVKEFRTWGPLGVNGRPLKSMKGKTYEAFLNAIRSLGYRVEDRVLNAANYGAATTRERLFIIARRGNKKIYFPAPTHRAAPKKDLFNEDYKKWRSAREIIDWSIPGKSIFNRKKPLAKNTLRRIEAGLRKFGGPNAEPFIVILRQHGAAVSVENPLSTITASGSHHGLVEPFIIPFFGERDGQEPRTHSIEEPLPTITTQGAGGIVEAYLIEPFTIGQQSCASPRSVDNPVATISTGGAISLIEPCLVNLSHMGEGDSGHQHRVYDVDKPMPTVTGKGQFGVVEPFIVPQFSQNNPKSVDDPLSTLTTTSRGVGLCEPVVIAIDHASGDGTPRPVDGPLQTITSKERLGLIEPYVVQYYGSSNETSIEDPLPTVTTKDRFALVTPDKQVYGIDIRFRMLQPHELSKAMGFPDDYHFIGNREAIVKQIGNAVEGHLSEALCTSLLRDYHVAA
jgi:DNA (cytosine-5)-methyltransferase 1